MIFLLKEKLMLMLTGYTDQYGTQRSQHLQCGHGPINENAISSLPQNGSADQKLTIEGKPGIGKTTVIRKLISRRENTGGFYTEEIREGGKRKGFKIITLDGKKSILPQM